MAGVAKFGIVVGRRPLQLMICVCPIWQSCFLLAQPLPFVLQVEKRSGLRGGGGGGDRVPRRMDRLRRSLRDSFRRRKEHVPESSKPHQWQADEAAVRAGTCNFHVKVRNVWKILYGSYSKGKSVALARIIFPFIWP
ncbi:hypothetical protein J437_LFUL006922 [Ladona fulva]|uniref:Uncharacterized protein n=1 Tax=Ladona fulva TaxID=123851 RepID=A0A8K0K1F9_LADFU|nr:hypothetical protein J437_LFUL006922 [Ladona fulva]